MDVSPLNLGMIAAYYYINYTTIGKNLPLPWYIAVCRYLILNLSLALKGGRDGAVVRALASHQGCPGSNTNVLTGCP